ncbi:hypothetical protein ACH5RR_020220 [Cinchona calisaya]|uniref:Uncharacterized protein n=1 Tax=Cinchona calisaya TaxID=153742 RepID=A0ABD2ZFM8_9GENT
MCGPRAGNKDGESCDSCDNQQPVTVQTEQIHVQGTKYQESVEESSKLQHWCMIRDKVYKGFGTKIYEGAVESYNTVTHKFKVVYHNRCFDEIEGCDLISYLLHHRNIDSGENASPNVPVQHSRNSGCRDNSGDQNASPNAPVQPSKKLPRRNNGGGENASPAAPAQPSRGLPHWYTSGKMTAKDSNDGGKVRTRPLMMRAVNGFFSSKPKRVRKRRGKSASRKRTRENVNQTSPVEPSSEVRGRKRAQNAGDINPPKQASKRRVDCSSKRRLLYQEYKSSDYVYYSPSADELSIWKMNRARAGSSIHVPIYIDSSDFSLEHEPSTVTFQTAESAVHGVVNQEAPEYAEGVVSSYNNNATMTFKTATDNGDYGETIPIKGIEIHLPWDLTRDENLAEKASPQLSTGGRGCTKNMHNESPGFHVQGDDVPLPEHGSTSGLWRSLRKRNQVYNHEGPTTFGRKLPRNAHEKPGKGGSAKKKCTSLRMQAMPSYYFP